MKSPSQKNIIAAILGACLFACNSPSDPVDTLQDKGAPSESGSEFDRSALSIKASPYSQREKISALKALASRYGSVVIPHANPDPGPNLEEAEKPAAGALGKTASNRYYLMKSQVFGSALVLYNDRLVKHNQTLRGSTTRPAGSTADPFIVAVHMIGFPGLNAQLGKVVALNDDFEGTLDSRFTWKNQTGGDQLVKIYAFAYTPDLGGSTSLRTTIDGVSVEVVNGTMRGSAVYDDNANTLPIANCQGPLSDRLSLQFLQAGTAKYGALMVNSQTMTVGYVRGIGQSVFIDMPTPTPSGYPNFMLPFAYGGGTTGSYVARQDQLFNCNF